MRFDRDRLIFLSLCVLDQACWRAHQGPVEPSEAIRLALACLYTLGTADKALFQGFWDEMRDPYSKAHSLDAGNVRRSNSVTSRFNAIARSVGVEMTMDYHGRLAKARRRAEPAPI